MTPFQTEKVKLHAIDLALLSPKTMSFSFDRSDDHETLFWTNPAHKTDRELTWEKCEYFSAGFMNWTGSTKCQLSAKAYKERTKVHVQKVELK